MDVCYYLIVIKFEDYRSDKDFKLDSLSFEEIYEEIKGSIEKVVRNLEKENFKDEMVKLNLNRCGFRMAYGKDKDLYPRIQLDLRSNYIIVLTTYEIKILVVGREIEEVQFEELDDALIQMMNKKFPNSDYSSKREKYFEDAELARKISYLW